MFEWQVCSSDRCVRDCERGWTWHAAVNRWPATHPYEAKSITQIEPDPDPVFRDRQHQPLEACMRAEIHHLLTPDIDPAAFVPDDPERFAFLVQMLAGPAGEEGEESFQFEVCTPGWLRDRVRTEGPMSGRHFVIVDSFNWPVLQSYFQRLVTRCWGADWHEVATKLSRYGFWEFEENTPEVDDTTPERHA
jgi:hypothetical protein